MSRNQCHDILHVRGTWNGIGKARNLASDSSVEGLVDDLAPLVYGAGRPVMVSVGSNEACASKNPLGRTPLTAGGVAPMPKSRRCAETRPIHHVLPRGSRESRRSDPRRLPPPPSNLQKVKFGALYVEWPANET